MVPLMRTDASRTARQMAQESAREGVVLVAMALILAVLAAWTAILVA